MLCVHRHRVECLHTLGNPGPGLGWLCLPALLPQCSPSCMAEFSDCCFLQLVQPSGKCPPDVCCALGNPAPLVGHGVTVTEVGQHLQTFSGPTSWSGVCQPIFPAWRDPSLWLSKCLEYQPLLPVLDHQQIHLGFPIASRAFFLFLLWQGFYLSFNSKFLRATEAAAWSLMDLNSQVHVAVWSTKISWEFCYF